ncbi:MaoC/PaaZ C-terminal domain-containing protein [Alloyangia pacifica]|uniref:MaoC/PaaZ C-terminal domain-containing protein n=1 Tax=Alloyangia pacifica TaxID=311180 RepID=UPI001CD73425|nr:MaoC/PaaZ C-terminal domain-containing protein [Alloyangia pacifica]MCA0995845.1 Nodulation protein N [Alloyangia pacifica]
MPAEAILGMEPKVSRWFLLDAEKVAQFGAVTGDLKFFHEDAGASADFLFGEPVAQGFLTLSLLSAMCADAVPPFPGQIANVNYGFDRVRFVTPVPVGSRVRGHFTVGGVEEEEERLTVHWDVEIEIEGQGRDQPALVAQWVTFLELRD